MAQPRHTPAQLQQVADAIFQALRAGAINSYYPLAEVVLNSGKRLSFYANGGPGLTVNYYTSQTEVYGLFSRKRTVYGSACRALGSESTHGETPQPEDWAYFEASLPILLRKAVHTLYRDAPAPLRGKAGPAEKRLRGAVVEALGDEEARALWPKKAAGVPEGKPGRSGSNRTYGGYRSSSSRDVGGGGASLGMGMGMGFGGGGSGCGGG